jgi:flagellar hook-associated protein 2
MMSSVTVNGKNYSLSSFGIMTSTDYTEGGLLHIYGDSDDSVYSSYDDKLKAALQDNPEDTAEALAGIFANLRSTMFDKMKAVANTSSTLTFYNDISMKNDISDYESEISDWEDKLADMEDAYYSKFTAMETALAKLQSQSSSVSSLFGS